MKGFWCDACGSKDCEIWYEDEYPGYQVNCVRCGKIFDVLSDGRYSVAPQTPPCPKCGWHNATSDIGMVSCNRCGFQFPVRKLIVGNEFEGRIQRGRGKR